MWCVCVCICVCRCARTLCAGVSLSSDFIAGFCEETEEDHLESLSLLRAVRYNVGFLFAYSMRKVRVTQFCMHKAKYEVYAR